MTRTNKNKIACSRAKKKKKKKMMMMKKNSLFLHRKNVRENRNSFLYSRRKFHALSLSLSFFFFHLDVSYVMMIMICGLYIFSLSLSCPSKNLEICVFPPPFSPPTLSSRNDLSFPTATSTRKKKRILHV